MRSTVNGEGDQSRSPVVLTGGAPERCPGLPPRPIAGAILASAVRRVIPATKDVAIRAATVDIHGRPAPITTPVTTGLRYAHHVAAG